jgi:hypothetical protein
VFEAAFGQVAEIRIVVPPDDIHGREIKRQTAAALIGKER